jgi:hypothetical protein
MTTVSAPATPDRATTRRERMVPPVATIAGLAVATVALHVRDPHVSGAWGLCPLQAVTGIYCPGCGGLRAVNDLTNGDLAGAASSNLLLVVLLPVAVFFLGRWALDAWRGRKRELPSPRVATLQWTAVGLVLLAFMVLRNLPAGAWLAP